jgi:hypothetical protein
MAAQRGILKNKPQQVVLRVLREAHKLYKEGGWNTRTFTKIIHGRLSSLDRQHVQTPKEVAAVLNAARCAKVSGRKTVAKIPIYNNAEFLSLLPPPVFFQKPRYSPKTVSAPSGSYNLMVTNTNGTTKIEIEAPTTTSRSIVSRVLAALGTCGD